jgi:type II secretory pathway pseudopilin PulG
MSRARKTQKGVTLIELGLGLALAGVLVAFVLVQFNRYAEADRARALVNFVALLVKEIPKAAPSRAYEGLTTATLIQMGGIPDQFLGDDGSTLVTPWQQTMTVDAFVYGDASRPNAVRIVAQGVPTAACVDLVQTLGGNMQVIEVGTEVLVQRAGPVPRPFSALTPARVATPCAATQANVVRLVPNV